MTLLPDYTEYKKQEPPNLRMLFTAAGNDALDLLKKLLLFDPQKRSTGEEVIPIFILDPSLVRKKKSQLDFRSYRELDFS